VVEVPLNTTEEVGEVVKPPVHPFTEVCDATYTAPCDQTFATLPKPAPAKKLEPAYCSLPPIYNREIAADFYGQAMACLSL
jgi:hypothetical protein